MVPADVAKLPDCEDAPDIGPVVELGTLQPDKIRTTSAVVSNVTEREMRKAESYAGILCFSQA